METDSPIVLPPAGCVVLGPWLIQTEPAGQTMDESFVVAPAQDVPGRGRQSKVFSQWRVILRKECSRLVIRGEQRPSLEIMLFAQAQKIIKSLRIRSRRPRQSAMGVSGDRCDPVFIRQDPRAYAMPPEASDNSKRAIISANDHGAAVSGRVRAGML